MSPRTKSNARSKPRQWGAPRTATKTCKKAQGRSSVSVCFAAKSFLVLMPMPRVNNASCVTNKKNTMLTYHDHIGSGKEEENARLDKIFKYATCIESTYFYFHTNSNPKFFISKLYDLDILYKKICLTGILTSILKYRRTRLNCERGSNQ